MKRYRVTYTQWARRPGEPWQRIAEGPTIEAWAIPSPHPFRLCTVKVEPYGPPHV